MFRMNCVEALGVEFVSKYLLGFLAHGQDFQIAGYSISGNCPVYQ